MTYPLSKFKEGDRAIADAGCSNATEVEVVYVSRSVYIMPECRRVQVRADNGYEWVTMEHRLTPVTTQ